MNAITRQADGGRPRAWDEVRAEELSAVAGGVNGQDGGCIPEPGPKFPKLPLPGTVLFPDF